MTSALETFAKRFPTEKPCGLWAAIQSNKTHTDPDEQRAVARAIVKDLLKGNAIDYLNAYYAQAEKLYPGRPFAAYNIRLFSEMPKFARRASKKRSKTALGWVHTFLSQAQETELLQSFENEITGHLPD